MSRNEWKKWIGVVGRLLLASALIFAQSALAGQNPKTTEKANSAQQTSAGPGEKQSSAVAAAKAQSQEVKAEASESTAAEEKPSSDASHQGIKVHGHWTIEVRNPDGSLATHREFENSYDSTTTLLPSILSRTNSVGFWQVVLTTTSALSGQAGPQPPCGPSGGASCTLEETQWPASPDAFFFNTLTVTQSSRTIILSGNVTAPNTGAINYVSTQNYPCPNTTAPSPVPCFSAGSGTPASNFTAFTFPSNMPPVNVSAGQTVQVNVTITFS
jgi:hypothetical protein